jgi:hypothetical protein
MKLVLLNPNAPPVLTFSDPDMYGRNQEVIKTPSNTLANPPNGVGAIKASVNAGGTITAGLHSYVMTFVTNASASPMQESTPIALSNIVVTTSANGTVNLANLPIYAGEGTIVGRNIYRTSAGNALPYHRLTNASTLTIANNTDTTYSDTASDATISSYPVAPTTDSTGLGLAPVQPIAINDRQYELMIDSPLAYCITLVADLYDDRMDTFNTVSVANGTYTLFAFKRPRKTISIYTSAAILVAPQNPAVNPAVQTISIPASTTSPFVLDVTMLPWNTAFLALWIAGNGANSTVSLTAV